MADTTGMQDIRGENVERAVKGFALQSFKLKQVCLEQSSSNWQESYYQETASELTATGGGGFSVKGVGRLSAFPHIAPSWTKQSSYHQKHAGEAYIDYEDSKSSAIDVQARTYLRVARAIAYSVDNAIYDVITADANVNTAAAVATWDSATVADRDPIRDILTGIEYCRIDNYEVQENGYLLLSPTDYTNLMMNSKVVNNPSFEGADVVQNGVVGRIAGLKIIVSNSIDADEACVIKGKEAVVYKVLDPLKTRLIEDAGIKWQVRAWEIGITQVVNPEAIHIITNTQA